MACNEPCSQVTNSTVKQRAAVSHTHHTVSSFTWIIPVIIPEIVTSLSSMQVITSNILATCQLTELLAICLYGVLALLLSFTGPRLFEYWLYYFYKLRHPLSAPQLVVLLLLIGYSHYLIPIYRIILFTVALHSAVLI